jgi:lipoprotein-anchoring transpeptidase ErfK/SrfK
MFPRFAICLAALATGLAAFMCGAAAQTFPAPYSYPPGGYRGVPLPDEDDVMTLDPDDGDDLPPAQPPLAARPDRYQPGSVQPRESYPGERADRTLPPYDAPRNVPSGYGRVQDGTGMPRETYSGRSDERGTAMGDPNAPGTLPATRLPNLFEPLRPPADVPGRSAAIAPGAPTNLASLPPEDQPEIGEPKELPPQFKRQTVPYPTREPAGTIIIDTQNTFLYLVLGGGQAMRYGIGVGREGFTWAGTERISKMAEWPDWYPPAEMIERQPYLPRFMAGGPGNPLGARALYLGKTVYRIHGTNQPSTIGKFVSSGCIRMLNEDVEDLFSRVKVGTKVVVLPGGPPASAQNSTVPINPGQSNTR